MDAKERAIDITTKLQAAEAAAPSPELDELHQSLAEGLNEQADALGLSDDDLAEIETAGTAARGGQPKEIAPDDGDEQP